MKYTFDLSERFLSDEEISVFNSYLISKNLETNIWIIYRNFFESKSKLTKALILRAYKEDQFCGAAIILRCKAYSWSLFDSPILCKLLDFSQIPLYLWIRLGYCMDIASNPGFVKEPEEADLIFRSMGEFLRKRNLLTMIYGHKKSGRIFRDAISLTAPAHTFINAYSFNSIDDYLSKFKNLKRKIKIFQNNKGVYNIIKQLKQEDIYEIEACLEDTAQHSVFHVPYKKLYTDTITNIAQKSYDNICYFVVHANDELIGYQAAIKTGNKLNCLHGAFKRNLKKKYYAYDVLLFKMTEFAIEHNLDLLDFGPLLNKTKARMTNQTEDTSYFIFVKFSFLKSILKWFLGKTKIQRKEQIDIHT